MLGTERNGREGAVTVNQRKRENAFNNKNKLHPLQYHNLVSAPIMRIVVDRLVALFLHSQLYQWFFCSFTVWMFCFTQLLRSVVCFVYVGDCFGLVTALQSYVILYCIQCIDLFSDCWCISCSILACNLWLIHLSKLFQIGLVRFSLRIFFGQLILHDRIIDQI